MTRQRNPVSYMSLPLDCKTENIPICCDSCFVLKPMTQTISTDAVDSIVHLFSLFFNVKETADVVLTVNSTAPIYTHRFILGCCSRRFWKMLLTKEELSFQETDDWYGTNVYDPIHIRLVEDDDCAEIFPEFIQFLYTERVELDLKNVWSFIRLGQKYDIEDLVLTCTAFIRRRINSIRLETTLVDIMKKARYEKSTSGVIQSAMHRLCKELFSGPIYSTLLLRMEVDILCDILRTNDVIVTSEYDLFTRLKPKLGVLAATGEDEQVLRLLSLLRLTHMTPSQLRELNSTKYGEIIRKAFPGHFERALWIKAYKADEFKDEFPVKIEKRREETNDIEIRGRRIPRHARDGFDLNVQYEGYAISDGYLWDFDQVFE